MRGSLWICLGVIALSGLLVFGVTHPPRRIPPVSLHPLSEDAIASLFDSQSTFFTLGPYGGAMGSQTVVMAHPDKSAISFVGIDIQQSFKETHQLQQYLSNPSHHTAWVAKTLWPNRQISYDPVELKEMQSGCIPVSGMNYPVWRIQMQEDERSLTGLWTILEFPLIHQERRLIVVSLFLDNTKADSEQAIMSALTFYMRRFLELKAFEQGRVNPLSSLVLQAMNASDCKGS